MNKNWKKDGEVHILDGNAKRAYARFHIGATLMHTNKQSNTKKSWNKQWKGSRKRNWQREKWCGVEQPTPNEPPNFGSHSDRFKRNCNDKFSAMWRALRILAYMNTFCCHTTHKRTQSTRTQCLPILRENFNVNAFVYLFVYWLESFCIPHCTLCIVWQKILMNTHRSVARYRRWKHTQDAVLVRVPKSFLNYNVAMFCLQPLWCRKSAKMDGICLFCDFNVSVFLRIH